MQIVYLNYTDLFKLIKSCHILTSSLLPIRFSVFRWVVLSQFGSKDKHAKCETIEHKNWKPGALHTTPFKQLTLCLSSALSHSHMHRCTVHLYTRSQTWNKSLFGDFSQFLDTNEFSAGALCVRCELLNAQCTFVWLFVFYAVVHRMRIFSIVGNVHISATVCCLPPSQYCNPQKKSDKRVRIQQIC